MRPHEKRDRISLRGRNTRGGACTRGEIRIGKRALSRLDGIFRFRGIECTHTRARASPGGAWLVYGQGEGETRGKMVVYSGDSCQWKIEIDDDSWRVYN